MLELVEKRKRIPNSELAYYEAITKANWIRKRTISQMDSRKENNRQE